MGTRHFVGVILDGDWKVAQYGQWDGYFEGQGQTVYDFVTRPDLDVDRFKMALRALRFATDEDLARVEAEPNWPEVYPWLSRNAGGEVLSMIYDAPAEQIEFLGDTRNFPLDGLFCEFAYVIDLDQDILEVYTGGHKAGTAIRGRWKDADPESILKEAGAATQYAPVSLLRTFDLRNMPDSGNFQKELFEAEAAELEGGVDANA